MISATLVASKRLRICGHAENLTARMQKTPTPQQNCGGLKVVAANGQKTPTGPLNWKTLIRTRNGQMVELIINNKFPTIMAQFFIQIHLGEILINILEKASAMRKNLPMRMIIIVLEPTPANNTPFISAENDLSNQSRTGGRTAWRLGPPHLPATPPNGPPHHPPP